jgi:excisionase family DNA binding protein
MMALPATAQAFTHIKERAMSKSTESQMDIHYHERLAYRVREAAVITNLGQTKLWSLVMSGEIPSFKVGKARLIPASGLKRWMRDQLAAEGFRSDVD